MKEVARFVGRVNKLNPVPEPSYVMLKNVATGEVANTDAVTEKLLEKDIDHDGCEFEVVVQESGEGKIEAVLRKVEPKPISSEHVKEIKEEFKGKWDI
jgi:hypothetical protein